MKKMKAIIVDDDKKVAQVLADKLSQANDVTVIGLATDAATGLQMVLEQQPDILFLDVELPDMDGITFMQQMEKSDFWCYVVIFTAFQQYMLPAFREQAFDYLLKPIDDENLKTILNRIRHDLRPSHRATGNSVVKQMDGKFLFYLNTVDFQLVNMSDIGFCQYNHEQRVWEVVVADMPKPIRLKRNVTNEQLLALDPQFVQVSQRFIVNIACLLKVKDNICYFYPPFDQIDYVKVGRLYRRKLIERFKTL